MNGNEIYTWSFSNDKQRGSMWYVLALSVVIGLVVWGFLTRQYVLGFLVILITGVTFFVENNSEETTTVSLTQLGLKINSYFYDYAKIETFSIIYDRENAILLRLTLRKRGVKFLDITINNEVVLALKEILPNFIAEDEKGELTLVDKLIRILKL